MQDILGLSEAFLAFAYQKTKFRNLLLPLEVELDKIK
jgi:hypothetical protein